MKLSLICFLILGNHLLGSRFTEKNQPDKKPDQQQNFVPFTF